jgi:hypothetical protein
MNVHAAPTPRTHWYDPLARWLRLQRAAPQPPKPPTMRQELLAAQERRLAEKREQAHMARRARH